MEAAAASAGLQLREGETAAVLGGVNLLVSAWTRPGDEPHPPRLRHHQPPRQQQLQSPFRPNSRQMTSPRFLFPSSSLSVPSACSEAEQSYTTVDIGNCLVARSLTLADQNFQADNGATSLKKVHKQTPEEYKLRQRSFPYLD